MKAEEDDRSVGAGETHSSLETRPYPKRARGRVDAWSLAVCLSLSLAGAATADQPPVDRASACFQAKYQSGPLKPSDTAPTEWPADADERERLAAAYMARGNVHEDCQQLALAIADFRAGVDGDPSMATYHYDLGDAYVRAGLSEESEGTRAAAAADFANAVAELEIARSAIAGTKNGGDIQKYLYGDLGTAYLETGNARKAVASLGSALDALGSAPDDQTRQARCRWLSRLGRAQLDAGAPADALRSFQGAAEAQPACPDMTFWQGMANVDLKNYDIGIDLISKQLAFSAGYAPRDRALLMIGLGHGYQLRGKVGDAREARRLYNEAMVLDPTSRAAALLATLPPPTGAPVFSAPELLAMDAIDERPTPPLCSAVERNAFLQSITDQVHVAYTTNVARLNSYVTSLGEMMSRYWDDTTLTYEEKKAYVAIIAAEHDRASAQSISIANHDKAIIGPFYAKIETAPVSHC